MYMYIIIKDAQSSLQSFLVPLHKTPCTVPLTKTGPFGQELKKIISTAGPSCSKHGLCYSLDKSLANGQGSLFCQHLSTGQQFIWPQLFKGWMTLSTIYDYLKDSVVCFASAYPYPLGRVLCPLNNQPLSTGFITIQWTLQFVLPMLIRQIAIYPLDRVTCICLSNNQPPVDSVIHSLNNWSLDPDWNLSVYEVLLFDHGCSKNNLDALGKLDNR